MNKVILELNISARPVKLQKPSQFDKGKHLR